MRRLAPGALVFLAGFVIMVLEIVGARHLARDFGQSFYVWVSQIGMILAALAAGYAAGGALGDRALGKGIMAALLSVAGLFIWLIPGFSPGILEALVMRHPPDQPIPALWRKLDPALGSALIFFLPCTVLAMMSPYMIRIMSTRVSHVGRVSGGIYAAGTVGSILGVFVSGYLLIDLFGISAIFRMTGLATAGLGAGCWVLERGYHRRQEAGRVGV